MAKNNIDCVSITADDCYLFGKGVHYEIYKKLGAHPSAVDGTEGYFFAVWAPNAAEVFLIGDFNGWQEQATPMLRSENGGIYTAFVAGVKFGQMYKYLIITQQGKRLYKADPYATYAELRPGTASRICDLAGFKWSDSAYLGRRAKTDYNKSPMAIYECHIGSFMRHLRTDSPGYYNYREFADRIVPYLKEMNYTHIELMGIAEYPFDGSWGYQVTGYFAPTARHGTPMDFMYLINELHRADIGVLLDWVPAHFPRDAFGLSEFDGSCLYEHPDKRLGEHPDWGTKIFNYSKTEVANFLIANALFWIKEYHIDGLRVDAVASMLYLDYGKNDGQWVANIHGGNENLYAIEFFRHLNSVIHGRDYPGVLTIAEESTAWPKVTAPVEDGGLGFSMKWNMGWMHDFCDYMSIEPLGRSFNHHKLTFAMSYNSSEKYILPLSHDEVVHLKCSMVNKMPGKREEKYAQLRVGYTYMFGHSGKKLLFMGQEFAQEREWSEERELDWFLLNEPLNAGMKEFTKQLLKLYTTNSALYDFDNDFRGFEWMNPDDKERGIYTFVRKSYSGKKNLLFILNFTPVLYEEYRIPVPCKGRYKLVLNSEDAKFGGCGTEPVNKIGAKPVVCREKLYSIVLDVLPYASFVYEYDWVKK